MSDKFVRFLEKNIDKQYLDGDKPRRELISAYASYNEKPFEIRKREEIARIIKGSRTDQF